ncbi:MAG: hypothetical protein KJ621_15595 [Proteobacteria bacterium]|nr:hypothetical protein [Pseudomonadota bacterium]
MVAKDKGKRGRAGVEANPAIGERGDFLRVLITMPGEMLAELKALGVQRRMAGHKDSSVSALAREAIAALLAKERGA